MSLSNGTYVINSLVDDRFVGRHPVEDLSLLPKRILAVTPNFQARRNTVEKSDSGCLIRAEGAPLAVYNGLVYGFLIEMQLAENWVITPQPQEGGDVYTVEKADRSAGWVIAGGDASWGFEVGVRPIPPGRTLQVHAY